MEELKLYPAWKHAVAKLLESGLTYGGSVSKAQIAELCGLRVPETIKEKESFDLQMVAFTTEIRQSLLHEHNMLMAPNWDGSYRIISPSDQTSYAIDKGVKAIAKEMRQMSAGLKHIDTAALTDDERRKNSDAKAKLSMLYGMQKTARKELRQISG